MPPFRVSPRLILAALLATGCGQAQDSRFAPPLDPRVPTFVDADVAFMRGMLVNHRQALAMAEMAASHGAGDGVAALSRDILASRGLADSLEQWLRDRQQTVPDTGAAAPGAMAAVQFQELDGMRGPAWDRAFLQYLIRNHQQSLQMIDLLRNTTRAALPAETFTIASMIEATQRTAIGRMQVMLQAMPARP